MQRLTTKIREWATGKGMSLSLALSTLGVSPSVFYNWEKGGNPTPATLSKMAKKMQIDLSELVNTSSNAITADDDATQSVARHGLQANDMVLVSMSRVAYNDMKGVLRQYRARLVGHLSPIDMTASLTENQQAAA